jgi:hypothetical protein
MRFSLAAIESARLGSTVIPFCASCSAGAIARRRLMVPKRSSAAFMPATTPGTPTVVCPVNVW